MAEVFISYARSTEAQARLVADALRSLGYQVWRDDELPAHRSYAAVIEERLVAAQAVVVIWSAEAVASEWVQSEADRARADRKLVQLSVDGAVPPMPFDRIQRADLEGWTGDPEAPGWRKVVTSVEALVRAAHNAGAPARGRVADAGPGASAGQRDGKPSICVLPFANMSGDAEQEYFSDGITEDIITDLSKVSALSVASRNSAFQFKGRHVDVRHAARQLEVSHVLEGSVRKAGNRVRITAQLIDAGSDSHVWAERYDRDLTDIFALQDEISQAIVAALRSGGASLRSRRLADGGVLPRAQHAAQLLAALGDAPRRMQAARVAMGRAERAVGQDASNGQAAGCVAGALAVLGEGDAAREWIARALRIDPDNRAMRYNLACSLFQDLHDADGALELLGPYMASATPSEIGHALADPDFDALRDDPRFQALIATAGQGADAAGRRDGQGD